MVTEESTILKAARKLQQNAGQLKYTNWVLIPLLLLMPVMGIVRWRMMIRVNPIIGGVPLYVPGVQLWSTIFAAIVLVAGLAWLAYSVVFKQPAARQKLRESLEQSGLMVQLASGTLEYEALYRQIPLLRFSWSFMKKSVLRDCKFVASNLAWFLERPRHYHFIEHVPVGIMLLPFVITGVLCLVYGFGSIEVLFVLIAPAFLPLILLNSQRVMWYEEFASYLIKRLEA